MSDPSEPSPMQKEVRCEALSYDGTNKFMLSLRRQARASSDWYPSQAQAHTAIKIRGNEAMTPASSKRLGGAAEHASLVGHQPRRRATMYPSFQTSKQDGSALG